MLSNDPINIDYTIMQDKFKMDNVNILYDKLNQSKQSRHLWGLLVTT